MFKIERLKVILSSLCIYLVFGSSIYLAIIDPSFRASFRELSFAIITGSFALLTPNSSKQHTSTDNYSDS